MTRTAVAVALATAALTSIAACSSTTSPNTVHYNGAPAHSALPPSPIGKVATTTQYASALAVGINDWQSTWSQYHDAGCLPGDTTPLVCGLAPVTYSTDAQLIQTEIDGAEDTTSHIYIGAPPAEIATLVQDTRNACTAVEADLSDPQHPADGWLSDVLTLNDELEQWGPYLH